MRTVNLILIIAFLCSCATASPLRTEVHDLRKKLDMVNVPDRYPEEYLNFTATMERADTFSQRGESLSADNVYRLALLKGRLLELRDKEPSSRMNSASSQRIQVAQVRFSDSPPTAPEPDAASGDTSSSSPSVPAAPAEAGAEVVPGQSGMESPPVEPPPAAPEPPSLPEPYPTPGDSSVPADTPPVEPELPLLPGAEQPTSDMKRFIGTRGYYTVKRGDTIRRVGARLGVDWRRLAKLNRLDTKGTLTTGQILVYDNRKIVPATLKNGIVINIADRTLYLLKNGGVNRAYPVALGKPPKPDEDEDWTTPTGRFVITKKSKDPTWRVPPSIQEEMERNGKEVIKEVPPGKDNPLGKYALKTSLSGIMIHSTNSPSSVYSYASHGCIRVTPDHMEQLFHAVDTQMPGMIIYQPVKLAVNSHGKVFLEVNRDVYDRFKGDLENEVHKLVNRRKVEHRVDWKKVSVLLKKKSGVPEEITLAQNDTPSLPPVAKNAGRKSLTISRTESMATSFH